MPVCQSSCTPKTPRVTWEASRTTGARPSSSAVSPRPASRYRDRYKYLCVYLPAGADAGTSTCACTCRLVQVPVQIPVRAPASRYRYWYLHLPAGTGACPIPCSGHSPDCRPFNSATANRLAKRAVESSYAVVSSSDRKGSNPNKRLLPFGPFPKEAMTLKNYLKTA